MVQRLAGFQSQRQAELPPETAVQRDSRIRQEAEVIARGEASIDAGKGITLAEMEHWLDALDDDEATPPPNRVQPASRR